MITAVELRRKEATTICVYKLVRLLLMLQLRGMCFFPLYALLDPQVTRVETNILVGLSSVSQLSHRLGFFFEARSKNIEVIAHLDTRSSFCHILLVSSLINVLEILINAAV